MVVIPVPQYPVAGGALGPRVQLIASNKELYNAVAGLLAYQG